MLGRLVAKLLFKACVPLVAVAGVMSYGVYLKGGDPTGLWKHVATGAFGKAGDMFSQTKNDAIGLAGSLTGGEGVSNGLLNQTEKTEVFTWKDAEGVTHFGTTAPAGVSAKAFTVDPNVNVLAPVDARRFEVETTGVADKPTLRPGLPLDRAADNNSSRSSGSNTANQSVRDLELEMGEPLPGVAGQLLSGGAAGGNGMDPSQLIRLLQSAGE